MQALIRSALLVLLAGATLSASAATVTLSQFPPNPGVLPGGGWQFTSGTTFANPPPPRAWVNGVYGSVPKVVATDSITLAGRAGPLVVKAAQSVSIAGAVGVVVRCAANLLCVTAVTTAAAVADRWRVKHDDSSSSGLAVDAGQGQQMSVGWRENKTGSQLYQTVQKAFQATTDKFCGDWIGSGGSQCSVVSSQLADKGGYYNGQALYKRCVRASASPFAETCDSATSNTNYISESGLLCPAYVDSSGAAVYGSVGLDGKCATGRYQGIAYEEAQKLAAQYPPITIDSDLYKAVQGAVDKGGQSVPADIDVTGPASQVGAGTSTVTTDSTGTKTTTSQPTYTYQYAGDTITYQTTNNTYTCAGTASCSSSNASSSTSTTTGTTPDAQNPDDPCTANPNRAGCVALGDAPSAQDVTKKDIPVSITPEGGFGADTGSCPAPITLASGVTVDPFKLFCTYMSGIRFAVVGVAWLIAALIFLGRVD